MHSLTHTLSLSHSSSRIIYGLHLNNVNNILRDNKLKQKQLDQQRTHKLQLRSTNTNRNQTDQSAQVDSLVV